MSREPKMEDGEWYAGWGTLTLINAAIAQNRGRSGLAWFLMSILLGPIATFLLVAIFNDQPESSDR